MASISTKISKHYRYFLYSTLTLSLASGIGFWLLRQFAMVEGDFGPESHPLQYPFLQFHGFAAFIMMMSLGAIFASHIPKTWSTGRAKKSGIAITSSVSFSMLSAYTLYYLVTEDWHELVGNLHAIVGLLLAIILFVHIKLARQSRSKKKAKSKHKSSITLSK